MNRRRRKKSLPPEEQARREREKKQRRAYAEQEAERERQAGIDPTDSGARYIAAAERGEPAPALTRPDARWRSLPPTVAQVRALRAKGINPLSVPTRGQASDALSRKR